MHTHLTLVASPRVLYFLFDRKLSKYYGGMDQI